MNDPIPSVAKPPFYKRTWRLLIRLWIILAFVAVGICLLAAWSGISSVKTTMNNLRVPVVIDTPASAKVDHGSLGWWASWRRDWKMSTGRYRVFHNFDKNFRSVDGVIVEDDLYLYDTSRREYIRSGRASL